MMLSCLFVISSTVVAAKIKPGTPVNHPRGVVHTTCLAHGTRPTAPIYPCADVALNVLMNIRKKDRETSLASVAGEVEMEEEGDGARLFQSEASNAAVRVCGRRAA